ncbi:OsmC family protein [Cohnella thailandensis]|uniref:OsmC family protein n=1 Tax=Cohnella thailandensis TaxID=557557 RepID=A0A841T055_9BACL|nr:OsmC family protein [Cohnella thailandensis]MBB6637524.1 OsmC family protein [Cohnella thailandensis]MBP1977557.1 putative OsmC-like protein [Cohnella thailandensis]
MIIPILQHERNLMMISITWSNRGFTVNSDGAYQPPEGASQSPMDILCESLGLCVAVTLVKLLDEAGKESDGLKVEVDPHKAKIGAPRVENMEVSVDFPGDVPVEAKERLLLHASRLCTIGNTLKRGSEIQYNIKT